MRIRKILALGAGGTLVAVAVVFGGLQTTVGQRWLVETISSLASTPDSKIEISDLGGSFPTDLTVGHVALSDRSGPWLRVEDAHVRWSFASLFSGTLRIDTVSAREIDLLRAPEPAKATPAPPEKSSSSFELPIGIDLRALSVDRLHLAAPLGGVDSVWRIDGDGLVARDGRASRVRLASARTDGPDGKLTVDINFDPTQRTVASEIAFDERRGGLAAALLGRPDLDPVSMHLSANGNTAEGALKLTVTAGDALSSNGTANWRGNAGATEVSVNFTAAAPGLPDSPLARVLRTPFTLVGEGSVTDTGASIRQATLTAGPGQLSATGQYDFAGEKLSGTATLESDDSGALSDLLGGATWRGLRLDLNADGSLATLHTKGHLTAKSAGIPGQISVGAVDLSVDATVAELATQPNGPISLDGSVEDVALASLGDKAPPPGRLTIAARTTLRRDGRIAIDSVDVVSPLVSVKGSGSVAPATLEGNGKASITVPDFAAFSGIAGMPLGGRGHLDLTAQAQGGGGKLTWQGGLEDLSFPDVPSGLVRPITLSGTATTGQDLAWSLDAVRLASEALTLEIGGHGKNRNGEIDLSLALPKLAAFDANVTGTAALKGKVTLRDDGADLSLTAGLNDVVHGDIRSQKLSLVLETSLRGSAVSGQMQADGDLAGQPLKLAGRFARDADGGISVPTFEGRWASAAIDIANLAVTKTSTTGSGHVSMTRLQDLAALIGADLGGSIDLEVATDQQASGTVRGKLRGQGLRSGGIGVATLEADTSVSDPFGVAATKATATLSGLHGVADINRLTTTVDGNRQAFDVTLQATGARTNGALAARIEPVGPEVRIGLSRFNGRYGEIPVALAGPARFRVAGAHVAIDPATFQLGGGRVTLSGVVDPAASDLAVDVAGMPLAIVEAFAPGSGVTGTLQAKLRLRGSSAAPQIDASYNASGIKIRRPETMFLPPMAVTGTAALAGQQASIDAKLSAGANSSLSLNGKGTLPQGGAPLSASASITGGVDLAPFAPIAGPTIQGVTGRLQSNLNLSVAGESITGSGTLNLTGVALSLPAAGMRLDRGEATLALQGNTLQIQRLRFQTAGNGEITASGSVGLDAAQGFPVDLRVETRRALLVSRADLIATVSSTIKLAGSTRDGLDVSGPVTIDKAEISIGAPQVASFPTVAVREINVPGVPNQVLPPATPGSTTAKPAPATEGALPIRLDLNVAAPSAIFVRGRGLDAEVGGQFRVTGDATKPIVLGSLSLRRGDFSLAGRRLSFTRGNVSLVTVDTIDPMLDFLATTQVGTTAINLAISGTPRAPKIELTSTPPLPPDEAMAMLLFGKVGSSLSPFELVQAAQALAELTGTASGSGFMGKLRSGLGLDRLSLDSSGSGPASTSIEAGRYVSPGVYVGTKQGAAPGSSRGTVEIDVFPRVKLTGDIGADSNGRIGAKMEWDY